MDCLNAQTRITSYVEGQLSGPELKEFLIHMEQCSGCREELEIYYTLMEATRQLDEGQLTTSDFMKELEDKMHNELLVIRKKEIRARKNKLYVVCIFLCLIGYGVIKLFDIPIPFINEKEVTWEMEKEHLAEYMIPYMYEGPTKTDELSYMHQLLTNPEVNPYLYPIPMKPAR